jgi:hypothetical protein
MCVLTCVKVGFNEREVAVVTVVAAAVVVAVDVRMM